MWSYNGYTTCNPNRNGLPINHYLGLRKSSSFRARCSSIIFSKNAVDIYYCHHRVDPGVRLTYRWHLSSIGHGGSFLFIVHEEACLFSRWNTLRKDAAKYTGVEERYNRGSSISGDRKTLHGSLVVRMVEVPLGSSGGTCIEAIVLFAVVAPGVSRCFSQLAKVLLWVFASALLPEKKKRRYWEYRAGFTGIKSRLGST